MQYLTTLMQYEKCRVWLQVAGEALLFEKGDNTELMEDARLLLKSVENAIDNIGAKIDLGPDLSKV